MKQNIIGQRSENLAGVIVIIVAVEGWTDKADDEREDEKEADDDMSKMSLRMMLTSSID